MDMQVQSIQYPKLCSIKTSQLNGFLSTILLLLMCILPPVHRRLTTVWHADADNRYRYVCVDRVVLAASGMWVDAASHHLAYLYLYLYLYLFLCTTLV